MCPSKEWSGLLAYTIKGSLKLPHTLSVTPKYIHLMDIGTQAATEYEFGPESVKIFDDYPEVGEMRMGNIHSHNSMRVFFSGTDMSELEENSRHHHVYLSVIVNNASDVIAKLAVNIESKTTVDTKREYTINDINNKPISSENTLSEEKSENLLYTIDLIAKFPKVIPKSPIIQKISNRFGYVTKEEEIKRKKAREKEEQEIKQKSYAWSQGVGSNAYRKEVQDLYGYNQHIPKTPDINPGAFFRPTLTLRDSEAIYESLVNLFTPEGMNCEKLAECMPVINKIYLDADKQERKMLIDMITEEINELSLSFDKFSDQALSQILKYLRDYNRHKLVSDIFENLGIL